MKAREIKFRAWTGEEMIFVHQLDIYPDSGSCRVNSSVASHYEKWPLMQFTGLLDKNGKEIYEGDVIQSLSSNGLPITHVVKYNDESCSYVAIYNFKTVIEGYSTMSQKWITEFNKEVIGNIYANPELLTKHLC